MDRRVLPIGFLLVLAAGGIVVHAPGVQAQVCDGTEAFEDDTNFQPPTGCWYTPSQMGTAVVNTLRPYQGTKSLAIPNAVEPRFTVTPAESVCVNDIPLTFSFYVNFDTIGTHRWDGFLGTTQWGFRVNVGGSPTFTLVTPTGTVGIAGLVIAADTWYGLSITVSCSAAAASDDMFGTAWLASDPTGTLAGASISDQTWGTAANVLGFGMAAGGSQHWIDNIQVTYAALPTISGTEVVVSGLTGGSMDAGGQNIIARLANGETIATYGASDLTQIATTSTPNCTGRHDGVNAALYAGESWMTYVDCDEDGESDSFKIRNYALGTPDFPCEEATGNVDNNDEVDIPNDLGDIGTISDLNPSYESRCDDELVNKASVGWGFSTIGGAGVGGRIGTFAVTYNSGLLADYRDEDNRVLDSTSSPEIDGFCAWQNPDTGKDYIAGVGSIAQTGVYEVQSSVVRTAPADPTFKPEVELVQKFLNSGTYGGGVGLACAKDSIAVYTVGNQVHLLDDITTSPVAAPGWPKAATASAEDGVAMSGSSTYIAILDGTNIKVYHRNGTMTANFAAPAGSFHNMEFDNSGEHLAVFTSTRIKVFDTSEATCEIDGNCAELGNLEDEGGPLTSFTSTGTATAAPALLPGLEDPALIAVFPGGATGAKTFFGVILIALLTFGFAAIWLPLGILGAVLGLAMAIGFGLLGAWVAVLVVIICGAVIALIFGRK